ARQLGHRGDAWEDRDVWSSSARIESRMEPVRRAPARGTGEKMAVVHKSTEAFRRAMTFAGVAECPGDGRWEIPTDSDICTEVETIALAFGFVRMRRPAIVVETGCNVGCVSRAIGEALLVNGSGLLFTCDVVEEFVKLTNDSTPANVHAT